jgi:hypothetical protein
MYVRNRVALVAASALTCSALLGGAPATAAGPTAAETPAKVTVLTDGLDGPRQLSATSGSLYVAESDTGQATRVSKSSGARAVVAKSTPGAQGVVRLDGRIYVAAGGEEPLLYRAKSGGKGKEFADPLGYELEFNPDNQTQETGDEADTLSNPYFVVQRKGPGLLLMADAGANDVLAVSGGGHLSTFFVPPVVTTGVCAGAENNTPAGNSCDPVPTGIAYGPDGNIYISALTAEAPGQGRVYVVNRKGKLLDTLTGFSGPTGVAVGDDGSVYVSEVLQGVPEEPAEPAATNARVAKKALAKADEEPAFDPATVGQIVKVAPDDKRTYAQVTMPTGLLYTDGTLYASAWSIAAFLPDAKPGMGQIVSVDPSSFVAQ